MPFVLNHPTDGVFVGFAMGLAFFTGYETAGQSHVATMSSLEEAESLMEDIGIPGLSAVEVESGHWKALKEADLFIGDMDQNELLYHPVAGSA